MIVDPVLPGWAIAAAAVLLGAFGIWRAVAGPRGARNGWMWASRLLMLALLVVVALRPGIPSEGQGPSASGGLEVTFVVDTTSSAAAEDWGDGQPRLDGVRADIEAIVDRLSGARFSLVTFDVVAVERVPLTSDDAAIVSAASVLRQEITAYSRGSSIDEPVELLERLLAEEEQSNPGQRRVLFYFGDGEQTAAVPPGPFDALAPMIDGGAVLGYGTAEGGRMAEFFGVPPREFVAEDPNAEDPPAEEPVYIHDPAGGDALSRIDEANLRSIADQLGVPYLHRTADTDVEEAVAGIDVGELRIEPGEPDSVTELYWIPAIPLGLLALLEILWIAAAIAELRPARRSR